MDNTLQKCSRIGSKSAKSRSRFGVIRVVTRRLQLKPTLRTHEKVDPRNEHEQRRVGGPGGPLFTNVVVGSQWKDPRLTYDLFHRQRCLILILYDLL